MAVGTDVVLVLDVVFDVVVKAGIAEQTTATKATVQIFIMVSRIIRERRLFIVEEQWGMDNNVQFGASNNKEYIKRN